MNRCPGHLRDCSPVTKCGPSSRQDGASAENGELLRRAAASYDVFVTADQNLEYQQNTRALPIAVVVLVAASNRLESLEPLVPALLDVLMRLQPRKLLRIGS